jgi:hypothetical protein
MTIITGQPPAIPIEEITAATAGLLAEARAAGLVMPFAVSCNDYQPGATLILWSTRMGNPATWDALALWAMHYGTTVTTRPSTSPGSIHATAAFQRDGLNYEVSAIIRPDAPPPDAEDRDGDEHQDEDE